MGKGLRVIAVNVTLLFLVILLCEFLARTYLRKTGQPTFPLLLQRNADRDSPTGEISDTPTSYLDPHLGYAHDETKVAKLAAPGGYAPGFEVYGDSSDVDAIRIVALGGSTTDPYTFKDESWPEALYHILSDGGARVCVFNGGVVGYSSSQELLKLIRDVVPLRPDIVISLNGVNDLGFVHSLNHHPMVHKFQANLVSSLTTPSSSMMLPNLVAAAKFLRGIGESAATGVNFGTDVDITPAGSWRQNIINSEGIARANGIQYFCYLQPIGGFGKYSPNETERADLEKRGATYKSQVVSFYTEAQEYVPTISFCTDLTDIFSDAQAVYTSDSRHQNVRGRRLIAAAIAADLERRHCFQVASELRRQRLNAARDFQRSFLSPRNEAEGLELCKNRSFEDWADGKALNWQVIEGQAEAADESTEGLRSIRLKAPDSGEGATRIQQFFQEPNLRVGDLIEVALDARSAEANYLGMAIYASVENSQQIITLADEERPGWVDYPGGGQWRTLSAHTVIPSGADPETLRLVIMLRVGSQSAALIDRVSVRKVAPTNP